MAHDETTCSLASGRASNSKEMTSDLGFEITNHLGFSLVSVIFSMPVFFCFFCCKETGFTGARNIIHWKS